MLTGQGGGPVINVPLPAAATVSSIVSAFRGFAQGSLVRGGSVSSIRYVVTTNRSAELALLGGDLDSAAMGWQAHVPAVALVATGRFSAQDERMRVDTRIPPGRYVVQIAELGSGAVIASGVTHKRPDLSHLHARYPVSAPRMPHLQ